MVVCRQALAPESFSTLKPSLGHPAPCRLACRIARELGHLLAIGGVFQKFISRIHRGHDVHFWCPAPLVKQPYIYVTKMGKEISWVRTLSD
jgi:hypothetical protein